MASPTWTLVTSSKGPPKRLSRSGPSSGPRPVPKPWTWTFSPNICWNMRWRFSCISPKPAAPAVPKGEAASKMRATESFSLTSVISALAFTSSTVPRVSPVSGSQTSSPSGAKISKSMPCRTPCERPRFKTTSPLPRIFATLPSTVIRTSSGVSSEISEGLYLSQRDRRVPGRIRRMSEPTTRTQTRTNRIGRHLPTSGGLEKTLRLAREQELETVQIFVSNPQGWAAPVPRPDAKLFIEGAREIELDPVVVHAKYLINLASPDPELRERSARVLAAERVAAGSGGAEFVVVHSGSHAGNGEEKGMERLVKGLAVARELAVEEAGTDGVAEPLVENSVGAGTQLCSTFDTLARVAERASVRVCVDTAHAYVAGYDLSTPEGAREVASELAATLGDRLALLHLNDPRNSYGSHRDGHERIGEGHVSRGGWVELFKGLAGVPAVMETPYATPETDAEQVRLAKELAGGLPLSRRVV